MGIIDFKSDFFEEIISIEQESFSRPWTQDMFLSSAVNENVEFKLVFEGDLLAGYCVFLIVCGEAEILNIAVSSKFRRRSFGRRMIEYICSFSKEKGVRSVFLEVRASNEPAINLYSSFKFEKIGIRKKYYIDEDAIVLRKSL